MSLLVKKQLSILMKRYTMKDQSMLHFIKVLLVTPLTSGKNSCVFLEKFRWHFPIMEVMLPFQKTHLTWVNFLLLYSLIDLFHFSHSFYICHQNNERFWFANKIFDAKRIFFLIFKDFLNKAFYLIKL